MTGTASKRLTASAMARPRSVTWLHGGRVYSIQWTTVAAAQPAAMPSDRTLPALGRSYFRYMISRSPGPIRLELAADGSAAYHLWRLPPPILEFGAPTIGRGAGQRWITYPILGGLETAPGDEPAPETGWSSVADDPVGPAGLLRFAARWIDDGLWIGVELEAFAPAFGPESFVYRRLVLPFHVAASKGFVGWWQRHLGAFAAPRG